MAVHDSHIKCDMHGMSLPAIACRHLREAGSTASVYIGWVQAEFDPMNREPGDLWAWCSECDEVYEKAGGWNEVSEICADFLVVCEQCFHGFGDAQR